MQDCARLHRAMYHKKGKMSHNTVQGYATQCKAMYGSALFDTSVGLCNAVQGYAELCMFEVSVKLCNAVQCYAELCTIPHKLIKMSVNISTIYISKKY